MIEDRGPLDLTRRIEDLEKQKKILKDACRRAGKTIKEQKALFLKQSRAKNSYTAASILL